MGSLWMDSMHVAQKPLKSNLKFQVVTLDKESNIARCGDEQSF